MRVLLACLAAFALSGCFAFDEIDAGMEIMEAHTPASKKKAKKEAEETKDGKPPTYAQKVGEWWGKASTLSSKPTATGENATVACKVDGTTLFTRKVDCLARGGRPG